MLSKKYHIMIVYLLDYILEMLFSRLMEGLICKCRSGLRSFKRRVAYSNVGYDRIHLHCVLAVLTVLLGIMPFYHLC